MKKVLLGLLLTIISLPVQASTIYSGNLNADVAGVGSEQATIIVDSIQTLTGSLTIPSNVTLKVQQGGLIIEASSYTLTINGPFQAGRYQAFSGFPAGNVTFGTGYVQALNAEWFGAKPDNATVDDTAINSVFAAMSDNSGQYLSLDGGAYLMTSCAIQINKNGVGVVGTNFQSSGINCSDANVDIMDVGGTSLSATKNGNFLRDFYVYRTVASAANKSGINTSFGVNTNIERVLSMNSANGFYFTGDGDLICETCITNYQLSTAISYKGIYVDGTNANASMIIHNGSASAQNVTLSSSYGIYHTGPDMRDLTVDNFSTTGFQYGKYMVSSGTYDNDIHIINSIDDDFSVAGMYLSGFSGSGSVSVRGGWENAGPTSTNTHDIDVESSSNVSITGGMQFQDLSNIGYGTGLYFNNVTNSTVSGNQFVNLPSSLNINNSSNNTFIGNTTNNISTQAAGTVASFTNSPLNIFDENSINGYGTTGVYLDTNSSNTLVDANQVNTANITTAYSGTTGGGGGTIFSGGALPNGTTATTQAAGDNSTDVATDQFVTQGASGASQVLLGTATASSSSSITFTSIPSGYDHYILRLTGIVPATNAVNMMMAFSTNNGSSYISSGYFDTLQIVENNGTQSLQETVNGSGFQMSGAISNGYYGAYGTITLMLNQSVAPSFVEEGGYSDSSDLARPATLFATGEVGASSSDVNAIKIYMASGNISSGKFALYGARNQ